MKRKTNIKIFTTVQRIYSLCQAMCVKKRGIRKQHSTINKRLYATN